MIVRDIMSPNPWATSVTSSVRHVVKLLQEADVRHIPILENDTLVGIVSDRDLRAVYAQAETTDESDAKSRALAEPVSSIMSSNVISVHPETEVAEVIDLMIEHRIGAVPVVEADGEKLVGIVSYVDALRAARDLL